MRSFMERNPEIAYYYVLYRDCRNTQLFSLEKTKGSGKQAKTSIVTISYATGYSVLPEPGGLLDQPHRMMAFFEIFLAAEREASFKKLQ